MNSGWKTSVVVAVAAFCHGCTVSPEQFEREKYTLRDDEVCRAQIKAVSEGNWDFQEPLDKDLARRGVNPLSCPSIVQNANNRTGAAVSLLAIGAALALASRPPSPAGYAPPPAYRQPPPDFDWAWDLFFNEHYALVWACRGVQTGQFADLERCNFKPKNDFRWPSKRSDLR